MYCCIAYKDRKLFETLGNNNNKTNKVSCHVNNATGSLACSKTDFAYLAPSDNVMGNILLSGNSQQWFDWCNKWSEDHFNGIWGWKEGWFSTTSALWLVLFPCCLCSDNQSCSYSLWYENIFGCSLMTYTITSSFTFYRAFSTCRKQFRMQVTIIRTISSQRKWKSRKVASPTNEVNLFGLKFQSGV